MSLAADIGWRSAVLADGDWLVGSSMCRLRLGSLSRYSCGSSVLAGGDCGSAVLAVVGCGSAVLACEGCG